MQLNEKLDATASVRNAAVNVVQADFQRPLGPSIASALSKGDIMLSIVIPLFNEEESIDLLYERLKAVLAEAAPNHEFIFVDDGSTDGSRAKLIALHEMDEKVNLILFRRNFGKAAALSAGFKRTRGDVVAMMDADLQDKPEELPRLINKLDEGYDLVTGWKKRRHDPIGKTLPSKLFNGVVGRYYNLKIHDFNCGFKLMRGKVARDLTLYGDFHRFIPVFASELGYSVAECAVEHAPREFGKSKYGMKRLVTGFLDFATTILITRFLKKPLQFFGAFAGLLLLGGLLMGGWLTILELVGRGGDLRALWTTCIILLVGGAQVMFLGLIGELIVRVGYLKSPPDEAVHGQLMWFNGENEDSQKDFSFGELF